MDLIGRFISNLRGIEDANRWFQDLTNWHKDNLAEIESNEEQYNSFMRQFMPIQLQILKKRQEHPEVFELQDPINSLTTHLKLFQYQQYESKRYIFEGSVVQTEDGNILYSLLGQGQFHDLIKDAPLPPTSPLTEGQINPPCHGILRLFSPDGLLLHQTLFVPEILNTFTGPSLQTTFEYNGSEHDDSRQIVNSNTVLVLPPNLGLNQPNEREIDLFSDKMNSLNSDPNICSKYTKFLKGLLLHSFNNDLEINKIPYEVDYSSINTT